MTFERGEGMPGRAWKTGLSEWVRDVQVAPTNLPGQWLQCQANGSNVKPPDPPDEQELDPADYPRWDIAHACGVRASFTVSLPLPLSLSLPLPLPLSLSPSLSLSLSLSLPPSLSLSRSLSLPLSVYLCLSLTVSVSASLSLGHCPRLRRPHVLHGRV